MVSLRPQFSDHTQSTSMSTVTQIVVDLNPEFDQAVHRPHMHTSRRLHVAGWLGVGEDCRLTGGPPSCEVQPAAPRQPGSWRTVRLPTVRPACQPARQPQSIPSTRFSLRCKPHSDFYILVNLLVSQRRRWIPPTSTTLAPAVDIFTFSGIRRSYTSQ